MKQVKTINLQGRAYAQVNERIKAFHEKYPNGSIITEPNLTGEVAFVKAIVTPDVDKPARIYSASSYGTLKGVKAFEKLETVAVGRALAYLGFSIDGSIASAEEMEEWETKQAPKPQPTLPQNKIAQLSIVINEYAQHQGKTPEEVRTSIKQRYNVESTKNLTLQQLAEAIATMKNVIDPENA